MKNVWAAVFVYRKKLIMALAGKKQEIHMSAALFVQTRFTVFRLVILSYKCYWVER